MKRCKWLTVGESGVLHCYNEAVTIKEKIPTCEECLEKLERMRWWAEQ